IFGKVYTRAFASTKEIALTFDDGPNEPYTSQILDVLKAENVQATFFLIGKNVELYPDVARRIVAEGHVIGNHTYSHNANHAVYPNYYRDIRRAEEVIYQTTGVIPDLYRPPHGKKSPWELEAIKRESYTPILWSIAVRELSGKPADTLAAQIINRARPGAIILLHDGYGTQHDV
ncbi:MAG: polysaccharide deacetylase family protein, partial [Dehalococcoidales bacterium]|nr:polysaccharide deacetylase family protein [Dehalococcoidales bacterium]